MKYVRESAKGRYQANINIGSKDYIKPNGKKGICVTLGTFSNEMEAHNEAVKMLEQLKTIDTYEKQRLIVTEYRRKHMDKERGIGRCCGIKLFKNWNYCPICGSEKN